MLLEPLSEDERKILYYLAVGLSDQEIGQRLHLSAETVKQYSQQLFAKLEADSRAEALRCARELQLVDPYPPPEITLRSVLPAPLTSFVGREQEIATVEKLLREKRLLTLTGMGGTGKTRLALEVARRLRAGYEDGVAFVQLASVDDPGLLLETIARSLDVKEQPGETLLETLHRFLASKQLLLLLDNFEHLVSGAPSLAELLSLAPRLTALVTSRDRLRLYGEQEFPLGPLGLPPPGAELSAAARSPAVQLFVDRSQATRPDFRLVEENVGAVLQICRLLDGLPLAIELAAAHSRLFSPKALLTRLQAAASHDSPGATLRLLSGGPRDHPARQQTMQATIDWSYHLLDGTAQTLFRRLALFVGGATLEAIAAVCWPEQEDGGETIPLLHALVDRNLLQVIEGTDSEPRFGMLHVVREYAREHLDRRQEAQAVGERHAHYYLQLAEQARAELRGPDQAAWLDRLETEHANLRRALHWAAANQQARLALRLAGALWRFWLYRSHLREGRRWLERVLALEARELQRLRATAFYGLGEITRYQRDLNAARNAHEESLVLRRAAGDIGGVSDSLAMLGMVLVERGEYAKADALMQESLALARGLQDDARISYALTGLALSAMDQNHQAKAREMLQETLLLMRSQKDQMGIWSALTNLGMVALYEGRYEHADTRFRQSLETVRPLKVPHFSATSLLNLGLVATRLGNLTKAQSLIREALQTFVALEERLRIAQVLEALASLAARQKRPENAATLWGAACALREVLQAPLPPVERKAQEQEESTVRTAMVPGAFQQAWSEGRRLAREELAALLAFALSQVAEPEAAVTVDRASDPGELTARELDVLQLVARGLTDKETAAALDVSPRTINAHLTSIYRKLSVNTRTAAARVARERGLV